MTIQNEDTWLSEKLVTQVKKAVVNRRAITARGVVWKLKWEPSQRNIVQAGMALRKLGWHYLEGNKERGGCRKVWVRAEQ